MSHAARDAISVIEIVYLVATALFILSLKWMSSPATPRRGVWAGEARHAAGDRRHAAAPRASSTTSGSPSAWCSAPSSACRSARVQMTAVPQRTALSHAFGALCVTLVGTAEFYLRAPAVPPLHDGASLSLEVILGSLTFTGSLMAAGKLQEILPQRPITYKGQNFVNLSLLAVAVALAVYPGPAPRPDVAFPADHRDLAGLRRAA